MKQTVTDILLQALVRAKEQGELKLETLPSIALETPKEKTHGDLATTLALTMAKSEGKPPRKIAEIIVKHLRDGGGLLERPRSRDRASSIFFLKQDQWRQTLFDIENEGGQYGFPDIGKGEKVQVEFVSANPTGPLHVGHGRGAAVGDALSNLLSSVGYDVQREFYINDAGRQIRLLAQSLHARYQQALGHDVPFPEDGYHGSYVEEIVRNFIKLHNKKFLKVPFDECAGAFGDFGKEAMLADIRIDLDAFGVRFDSWFSEKGLLSDGSVQKSIAELKERGHLYEQDGALWLKSTTFGDDKDRVVVKKDGGYTYLATDIAYHRNKLGRGFTSLVNIWGADHHGYIRGCRP